MSLRRIVLFSVLGVVLTSAGVGLWWLTRRPLSYAARSASADVAEPPVLSPAGGDDHDAPEDSTIDEASEPLELPPEVIEQVEIARVEAERVPTPTFRRTQNYALIGVDRTWGRRFGRADTIMVAVFDDETGHVGAISVPRDLYVDVPDHGAARINATLRIAGRLDEDPLELARDVISDTLAMPIHHVVVADLSAFERTVDGLGGVTVDVPCAIADNFIDSRTETGRRVLDVNVGARPMDGVTAAMYVRSRHGRSDISRVRRQQAVLLGLRDRVRTLGATEWIPVLSDAVDTGVTTTMSRLEMIALARRIARIESERIHGVVIGSRQVERHRTTEGRSVLLPQYDAIDTQLRSLFDAPSPGVLPEHARCPDKDVALR